MWRSDLFSITFNWEGKMLKEINIRVCLAIVENNKILLVPHYGTDASAVQWVVPGGKIEFGESY